MISGTPASTTVTAAPSRPRPTPPGSAVWTSPVEPGSVHDLTAARTHALAALYPVAVRGLPVLADKGYTGAGIGVHVPTKGASLAVGNRARNLLLTRFGHRLNVATPY